MLASSIAIALVCVWNPSLPMQQLITRSSWDQQISTRGENNVVELPIALGGNWPWPSRSTKGFKVNLKVKNYPILSLISHHQLKLGPPHLDPKHLG